MRDEINCRRIFCIGRNYIDHASEMNSPIPEEPVVFLKPPTSIVPYNAPVHYPSYGVNLQHEVEVVLQIGREGRVKKEHDALSFISSVTLGLDLTIRDLQRHQKQEGLPWEIAKAFDHSAPLGLFVSYEGSLDLENIAFSCSVNGKLRQSGNTGDMIFNVPKILVYLSRIWTLLPGDIIFTGTPAGVGQLSIGDRIEIESETIGSFSWPIIAPIG